MGPPYVDELVAVADPDSLCYQDSYSKFRARLIYQPASDAWEASLYGQNISDTRYLTFCNASRSGTYDYRFGAPDSWSLEFVYRMSN